MSATENFGPLDEKIRVEASDWFARMRGPQADSLRREFEAWCSVSAHRHAYEQIVGRWEQSAFIGASATGQSRHLRRAGIVSRYPGLSAAAAIACVIGCSALLVSRHAGGGSAVGAGQAGSIVRYETKDAAHDVALSDGSRVTLDRASLLLVSYTPTQRSVRLDHGRARFWAVHDQRRPFVVHAGASEVRADANTFDVAYEGGAAAIIAVSGTLSVRSASSPEPARLVLASQQILIPDDKPLPTPAPSPATSDDWLPHMITLDHSSLTDAAVRVGRGAPGAILFDDDASALQITGTFRSGDVEGLARTAQSLFHLRRRDAGTTIYLSRGPRTPENKMKRG